MRKDISKKDKAKSIFLLQPSRPVFCTTKNLDGSDHIAPFSWIMPISCNPPRVILALQNQRGRKKSKTLVNILREYEFVLNMPHIGQEEELIRVSLDLKNYQCKFDKTGFTRLNARNVKPVMIAECTACLECRVYTIMDTMGDHTLLLANILNANYDDEYYDTDLRPNIPKLKPLINLRGYRFDEKHEHVFIKTNSTYRVSIPYKKEEEA